MRYFQAAVGLMAVLVLAGCTGPTESAPPSSPLPTSDEMPEPAGRSPLDLVGLWAVTEADGAPSETWLSVGDRWLTLWTPCQALSGSWVSDGARVRTQLTSGFGPCLNTSPEPESWFAAIRGFEPGNDGVVRLVGEAGDTVAVLTPSPAPAPFDFAENGPQQPEVNVVTDEMLATAEEPAALDPSLVPVDDARLAGRWTLAGYEGRGSPEAVFDTDGSYRASDGCNSAGGPLLVNAGGRFRAGSQGGMTQVGCDNVDLPDWIESAARAGIDPETDELVLVNHYGTELARLEPALS